MPQQPHSGRHQAFTHASTKRRTTGPASSRDGPVHSQDVIRGEVAHQSIPSIDLRITTLRDGCKELLHFSASTGGGVSSDGQLTASLAAS